MTDIGRPEYPDDQYESWLDDMRPFLQLGYSLYYAMDKAMLLRKKDSIYRKYRLNDWFCEKVDAYRKYLGEIVNSIFTRQIYIMEDKQKRGEILTDEEWRNLRFIAEKHRSCQPYFINRQEVAQVEPDKIDDLLDKIELENQTSPTDYNEVAARAEEEMERRQLENYPPQP